MPRCLPNRYSVKLLVVPEESERCTGVILVDGRLTSLLSAAMAGSFQVVIVPAKILAIVAEDKVNLSTPERL